MFIRKRTLVVFAGIAALLLALITSVSFLATLFLNRPVMKERIRSALSREIKGTVNFQKLDVSLFPLPHLTVRNLDIAVTGTAAARSSAVAVYPQLVPLFRGRLLLAKIELVEPDATVFLQDRPEENTAVPTLPEVKMQLDKVSAALGMIGPGFVVRVISGKLVLSRHKRPVLTLTTIDGRIAATTDIVEVMVHAHADAWGPLALKGKLTYDQERAALSEVSGTLGRSSFSELSARLALSGPMELQVLSGKAVLLLDELYPWLLASGEAEQLRKQVQSLTGSITLSDLGFGGPLARMSDWQLAVTGRADNVIVKTVLLPAPLAVSGGFTATRDAVSVKGLSLSLGKSQVSRLSASLSGKKNERLVVNSGEALIALDQLSLWRSYSPLLHSLLKEVRRLSGTVRLSQVSLSGPLKKPAFWNLAFQGEANNVIVDTTLLPAPLSSSGQFSGSNEHLELSGLSAALGSSSVENVSARIDWKEATKLDLRSGTARIALDEVYQWRHSLSFLDQALQDLQDLKGIVRLSAMKIAGNLSGNNAWEIMLAGNVDGLAAASPRLPGPISITQGGFNLGSDQLSLTNLRATVLDASVALSGQLKGFPGTIASCDLSLDGTFGPGSIKWAFDTFTLPKELMVNPFSLSQTRIAWQKPEAVSFTGTATLSTGPVVFIDLAGTDKGISVHGASIKDQDSNALFSYDQGQVSTSLSFTGSLAQNTVNKILVSQTVGKGKVTGDLRATLLSGQQGSTFQGSLKGDDIVIPWFSKQPLKIKGLSLHADGNIVTIDSADLAMGNSRGLVTGTMRASAKGVVLALTAAADHLDMNEIQDALSELNRKKSGQPGKIDVSGTIAVQAAGLLYDKYTFSPVQGTIAIDPSRVDITINEARLCGLSVPGTLVFANDEVQLDFKPTARAGQLGAALACLERENTSMSGVFDLTSFLTARGKAGDLLSTLDGRVDLSAKNGVIHKYKLLAKVFSLLSVTEIFRGRLPDFGGSGFSYRTMTVSMKVKQGKFIIEQAFIDGTSITLLAEGEVDSAAGNADLVLLVAPFSTVNWYIRHIPLLGKVMGGTLISIPVKVSGKLDDPDVTILAPSAVGSRIVTLFRNILELPIEIISPILPERYKEEK